MEFESYECRKFRKKLTDTTRNARSSSKIVRPTRSHVTGIKRGYGTSHGVCHSERKKNTNFFSLKVVAVDRVCTTNPTTDGSGTGFMPSGERGKEQRKEMCGAFALPNGERNQDFCAGLMNTELEELDNHTAVDCATKISGVYVWSSSRDTEQGIQMESTRFLTYGQKMIGAHTHNAVLMWNPLGHKFKNNTCPYNERIDH